MFDTGQPRLTLLTRTNDPCAIVVRKAMIGEKIAFCLKKRPWTARWYSTKGLLFE